MLAMDSSNALVKNKDPFGNLDGLFMLLQDFVVEHRNVQVESESDRVRRSQVRLRYLLSVLILRYLLCKLKGPNPPLSNTRCLSKTLPDNGNNLLTSSNKISCFPYPFKKIIITLQLGIKFFCRISNISSQSFFSSCSIFSL
jgi:hypothetical protein